METRPDATPEMIRFMAKLNTDQDKSSKARSRAETELKKKIREINEAVVGFGVALNCLSQEKIALEDKLVDINKEYPSVNTYNDFTRKFGVNPSQLNMMPPITQKEVDARAKEDDID